VPEPPQGLRRLDEPLRYGLVFVLRPLDPTRL